ncbi:hypothetical protein [Paenibacillus sp. KN14-4R]|uniref:hypothetical protein n=1 Tax=Paenibacillus sp. KN14-4R TaxID=3445773 RepID=UPI003FA02BA2
MTSELDAILDSEKESINDPESRSSRVVEPVHRSVNESGSTSSTSLKSASILLYLMSIILIIVGFIVMFHYGDYKSDDIFSSGSKFGHIVGGDAYNYIIIGIRGVGFIVTGFVVTVIASTLLIIDTLKSVSVKIRD